MARYEPKPIFQTTKDKKHPDGTALATYNCNPTAGATLIDLVTCGAKRPSGAAVREKTGDLAKKGTNNSQVAAAMRSWGVTLTVDTGVWQDVARALFEGRGVSLAGSAIATHGTKFQARKAFSDNHQWALTDVRKRIPPGETKSHWEIRVFDPLADGKEGLKAAKWMPAPLVAKFAANLDMRTPAERKAKAPKRPIGSPNAYYGKTDPLTCDDRAAMPAVSRLAAVSVGGPNGRDFVVTVDVGRVRAGPTTQARIVGRKHRGEHFIARQRIEGQMVAGDRTWLGDRTGHNWMHRSVLKDA